MDTVKAIYRFSHRSIRRHFARHFMKSMAAWIAFVLLGTGFMPDASALEEHALKLMIVSDLHYLSPSLYEDSRSLFENALKSSDGKMSQYSRELLDALMLEARHQQPDALIITGDLSFNGEKASHLELAAAFEALRLHGIDVWVMPGNHDINYPYAGGFSGSDFVPVPNISPDAFRDIYAASMGSVPSEASHMSYAVRLRDDLWLAMCDVCIYDPMNAPGGLYTADIETWLQSVLDDAAASGARVITATHQSMIPHTEFMAASMSVLGGERMTLEKKRSGRSLLNLSGHLHLQHISESDGIFDIATGAMCVPPFRYGMLSIRDDGSMEYQACSLCREHLPEDMAGLADTWFETIVMDKERPLLTALHVPEKNREQMLAYAARLNHAYFSGDFVSTDDAWSEDPAFAMWKELVGRDSFAAYLTLLPGSPENAHSSLHLVLPSAGSAH